MTGPAVLRPIMLPSRLDAFGHVPPLLSQTIRPCWPQSSSSSSIRGRLDCLSPSSCRPYPRFDDELWSTSDRNLSTLKGSAVSFSNWTGPSRAFC